MPVIDDLPTFVLLISMVRRLLILLLFPLQCLSSLTAPSLRPLLTFSTLQLNYSPPFSPLPHSYAFVSLPKTPPVKSPFLLPPPPPPGPCFKFQVYILHGFISKLQHLWRLELDTVAYIHRVKQTIVHMILSRSVHQNTYGDVIKAFCKKTSLQRTPLNNGHYCSSQRCPLFGGSTVIAWYLLKTGGIEQLLLCRKTCFYCECGEYLAAIAGAEFFSK